MSFLLSCPHCGPRDVYEFRFGGEYQKRPAADASRDVWVNYLYLRSNEAGVQREWWYHRLGCGLWFLASRDTRTNTVLETVLPVAGSGPAAPAPAPG
jgi:sarcosine oxidase subunit delta